MKVILQQLSAYHLWANTRLLTTLNTLPEETLKAPAASSFNSVQKTVLHLYEAEKIWWQRLQQAASITTFSKSFDGSMQELSDNWLHQNSRLNDWIAGMDEKGFEKVLPYKNTKGEAFEQPLYQLLLHLLNHATYHRGQIITMLRQLNVEPLPATDFILWCREAL